MKLLKYLSCQCFSDFIYDLFVMYRKKKAEICAKAFCISIYHATRKMNGGCHLRKRASSDSYFFFSFHGPQKSAIEGLFRFNYLCITLHYHSGSWQGLKTYRFNTPLFATFQHTPGRFYVEYILPTLFSLLAHPILLIKCSCFSTPVYLLPSKIFLL